MKSLDEALRLGKTLRVIGVDDAPFGRARGSRVHVAAVVCALTRMEGMCWGHATRDGRDATDVIGALIASSKFLDQSHLVLLDGVAISGWNVIDLEALHQRLDRPCVAVMRRPPDMGAVERSLALFEDGAERLAIIRRAGPIHTHDPFVFQVVGAAPNPTAEALSRLTDRGHVPEALRLAHLIGAAVMTGQSSQRA